MDDCSILALNIDHRNYGILKIQTKNKPESDLIIYGTITDYGVKCKR